MKKFIKLLALSLSMIMLAACTNNEAQKESTTEAPTTVAETSTETTEQVKESNSEKESNNEEVPGDETSKEASEDAVKFTIYVHGEEQPELAFAVEDAEGMSVREAMESQKKVPVNFSEEEGVFVSINDIENNYATGETWAYLYNGMFAELGVVSQKLEKGDEIAWYFGTVDEIPETIIPAEDGAVE